MMLLTPSSSSDPWMASLGVQQAVGRLRPQTLLDVEEVQIHFVLFVCVCSCLTALLRTILSLTPVKRYLICFVFDHVLRTVPLILLIIAHFTSHDSACENSLMSSLGVIFSDLKK